MDWLAFKRQVQHYSGSNQSLVVVDISGNSSKAEQKSSTLTRLEHISSSLCVKFVKEISIELALFKRFYLENQQPSLVSEETKMNPHTMQFIHDVVLSVNIRFIISYPPDFQTTHMDQQVHQTITMDSLQHFVSGQRHVLSLPTSPEPIIRTKNARQPKPSSPSQIPDKSGTTLPMYRAAERNSKNGQEINTDISCWETWH